MIERLGGVLMCVAALGCSSSAPATTPAQPVATQPAPAAPAAPATPAPAPANDAWETITHEGAGIMFDIPVAWDDTIDDEGMGIGSPDGEAYIVFLTVQAGELESAIDMVYDELSSWVSQIELGDGEDTDVNGMPGMLVSGQGIVDGAPVLLGLLLVDTPSGQILLIVGVGQESISEANLTTIDTVVNSIRPLSI